MSLHDLAPLAEPNLANVQFQGNTPEQRMLTGFVLAKQYMQQLIPQGHSVNLGAAIVAQEGYEAQVEERREIVAASLRSGSDLPESAALSARAEHGREYWLSTYALASEGIGAYATGYAAQQVQYGLLSQADYNDSIVLRTKSFANIVQAGQRGQLAALVTPEAYFQNAMQQSQAANTMRVAGQISTVSGGKLLLANSGSRIFVPNAAKQIVPVQLGEIATITTAIIAGALVIAIIGTVYVAYTIHASVEKDRIRASAEFMGRMCRDAMDSGHETTLRACQEYADKISTPTPQPFGLDNLSKYLTWGAVGLAALWMLPTLVERMDDARSRSASRRAARGEPA